MDGAGQSQQLIVHHPEGLSGIANTHSSENKRWFFQASTFKLNLSADAKANCGEKSPGGVSRPTPEPPQECRMPGYTPAPEPGLIFCSFMLNSWRQVIISGNFLCG